MLVFQHIPTYSTFPESKNKTLLGLHSSGHCPPSQSTTRTSSWTPASTSTLLEHFISHVPSKIQTTSHIETCALQFYMISLQYHVLHESSGVSSMPPSMDLVRRVIQALENMNRKKLHRLWLVIGLGGCGQSNPLSSCLWIIQHDEWSKSI